MDLLTTIDLIEALAKGPLSIEVWQEQLSIMPRERKCDRVYP